VNRALILIAGLACVAGTPMLGVAQTGVEVGGRVFDAGSGGNIQNALVTLEGHGAVLSSEQGMFRFEEVESGTYVLRVTAYGYTDLERSLVVAGDTLVVVPLSATPLELDPLLVEARTFDFDGRARDPARDSNLMDARVLSDQGHDETTDVVGRFDLDDVYENAPIRIVIRAFRFLPLDTTFVPDDEGRYVFDLVPDPLVERMIEVQNQRLADRAGDLLHDLLTDLPPVLDREDMAYYLGPASLVIMLEAKYSLPVLRRVACVVLDEKHIPDNEREYVLQSTHIGDLERIELLEFPLRGNPLMLRMYTRRFFSRLIGSDTPLQEPMMHLMTRTCR